MLFIEVNLVFYINRKTRQGISEFFVEDTLNQLINFLLISCWSVCLFKLWQYLYRDVSSGWLVVPVVFVWWLMSGANWSTYREVVGKRARTLPSYYRFTLLVFLILLVIAALIHVIAFLVVFIAGLVSAMHFREHIQIHQQEWNGRAAHFLRPAAFVQRFYARKTKNDGKRFSWGFMNFPWIEGVRNFALFGAISAGKSMMLNLLMKSFVPLLGSDPELKGCLIYDAKTRLYSLLRGMNSRCKIYILNYRDARCFIWHMAADITDRLSSRAAGVILSPPLPARPGNGDFWVRGSQQLIEGVCLSFTLSAPGNFYLRDILIAMRSPDRLKAIFSASSDTEEYSYVLEGDRMSHSLLTTVQVYLSQFAPIAAAWHEKWKHSTKLGEEAPLVSIRQFINEPAILLLGQDVENLTAMSALNRLIITLYGRFILKLPSNDQNRRPRNIGIYDEFHTIGRIDEFPEFITNGSSFGACNAVAVQSYSSLEEIYGSHLTDVIMGQFFNKAFLRLNDHKTATWASNLIGRAERFKQRYNSQKKQWEDTDLVETVQVVTPEELRRESPPEKGAKGLFNRLIGRGGAPLKGYWLGQFGFWQTCWPEQLSKRLGKPADVPDIIPWSIPNLDTWTWEDIERLGLTKVISPEDLPKHQEQEEAVIEEAKKSSGTVSETLRQIKKNMRDRAGNR